MGALAALAVVSAACGGGGTADPADADAPAPAAPDVGDELADAAAADDDATADAEDPAADEPLEGPFAVGSRTLTFVDTSRPTEGAPERDIRASDDRTLEVLLLYPSFPLDGHRGLEGSTSGAALDFEVVQDRQPAEGRFPLVVFSHGVGANGPLYEARTLNWVREGYIVALPTYPLTSDGAGFGDVGHAAEQPADVSFVIDELLGLDPEDPHADSIDGDRIAAAGHSLGAITTHGAVYGRCCIDERIDAAVTIAGIQLPIFEGDGNFDDPPDTPLLLVHGANDTTVPVSGSDTVFDAATDNTYYLRYGEGDHIDVVFGELADDLTDQAAIAFLDAYLKDDRTALDGLADVVEASGVATFRSR